MQVLVSGSHGLLGSALLPSLANANHRVIRLVRSRPSPSGSEVLWDPETQAIDEAGLKGVEAVIHLAGESIASGRWTASRRRRIQDSRVNSTRLLCRALSRMSRPPKVLVCASAVGFYGDRGNETLTESSPAGQGFLPVVCQRWEASAEPAVEHGIRVVWLRFGIILSTAGGALARLLPVFRLGLGGRLGSGNQYMSWISIYDAVGIVRTVLEQPLAGPLNAVSPNPVTNREFTATLAGVLRRPAFLPVPATVLRLALGEMADALLLSSARAVPQRLAQAGFEFQDADLVSALRVLVSGGQRKMKEKVHAPLA